MWIFTRESFLSIVRDHDDQSRLLVRARRQEDILRRWPDASVLATPGADYGYRASVAEHEVVRVMADALRAIDYETDFKGGVRERDRHDAYLRVWSAMRGFQR
jgi:hypothetical protein